MTLFNIITDLGSTFVSGKDATYVKNGSTYVRVDGNYLNPGDMVLFRKDCITKGLDEVDSVLDGRRDTYREAKLKLFELNENGIYVPRLRTNIIRGIEGANPDIEDKILRNGDQDFEPKEYRPLVDLTHEVVSDYADRQGLNGPKWLTVLNWVKGNVVAPAETRYFEALAKINPEFNVIYRSFSEGGEFKDAYEYYIKVRKGIMAYLARLTQREGDGAQTRWGQSKGGTIGEEIELVLEEFGTDIESQFVDANIVTIERVKKAKERGVKSRRGSSPHLFRGIYTGTENPENRQVLSIGDIDLESKVAHIDWSTNPELLGRTIKEICVEYGFPINMMVDYVLEIGLGRDIVNEQGHATLDEAGLPRPGQIGAFLDERAGSLGINTDSWPLKYRKKFATLITRQEKTLLNQRRAGVEDLQRIARRVIEAIKE